MNIYCNESPYSPMGSSIYSLEYGYPEEVLRNRKSWPVKLNKNDTIHFKMNCFTKMISLFYNNKLVHSLNLADIDFENTLIYPTISLPIVEKEIIEFEMRTDSTDIDYNFAYF